MSARSQDYHYKDSMEIIIFSKSFKKYFFSGRRVETEPDLRLFTTPTFLIGKDSSPQPRKKYFLKLFEKIIISIESL